MLPSSLPVHIRYPFLLILDVIYKFSPLNPLNLTFYRHSSRLNNLSLESFVAIMTSALFKKVIPETFLPNENFPLLFLQSILVDQLSLPKLSHW